MSVAGLLIINIQGLTGLPTSVHNAVVMVRVLSRKERRVPRSPETVTGIATVSDQGIATFEVDDPHIEVYTPFPKEDVVRLNIATSPHDDPFATAPLIRVSVLDKSRRVERTFALTHPKTKEPCGTLKLLINYVPPTVIVPEDVIAEKLRETAAPGRTMTFKQALTVLQDVDQLAETAKQKSEAEDDGSKAAEDDTKISKSKKHSHRSHRHKSVEPPASGESGGSGSGSKHNSIPPTSAEDLTAAMNAESDAGGKSQPKPVPQLRVVMRSAGDTTDLMLGPTPRSGRESLRNVVESRPRGASGGSKGSEKLARKQSKTVISAQSVIVVTPCENLTFGLNSRQASLKSDGLEQISLQPRLT